METIYGLVDPRDGLVKYIGYTGKPIRKRLRTHIRTSITYNKTHKQKWIRKLIKLGLEPTIKTLKVVKQGDCKEWEKRYIKGYKDFGFKLVNGTEGGDGITMTKEIVAKIVKKRRAGDNYQVTAETRNKMSLAKLGRTGKLCPNSKGLIAYNEKEEIFFHSAQEAEDYFKSKGLRASKKNISACLRGYKSHGGRYLRKQVAGFKFKRI